MPKLDGRGGKHRTPGPHETPEFCAEWERRRLAGETKRMTGSRENYARAFAWGRQIEREPLTRERILALRVGPGYDIASGMEIDIVAFARAVERAHEIGDKP